MIKKPLELAFSYPPATPLHRSSEVVARAEEWGYDMVYVPDQGFFRDPFVMLSHIATRVERIRFGLAVTNPYTRNPAQIARAVGALADLRPEGFFLGLGSGERANLRDRLGAPRTKFLPLLRQTIEAIRDLLDGQTVSLETPAFVLRNVALEFAPENPVPIYIATTSPAGYRLVGEIGDGLILGDMAEPEVVRQAVELVAEGARAAGRDPSKIAIVAWLSTVVTDDVAGAISKLRPNMAMALGGMHPECRKALGFSEEQLAAIKKSSESGTISKEVFSDADISKLAVIGPAEDCVEKMREIAARGVSQLAIRVPAAVADVIDFESNLEAFSTDVFRKLSPGSEQGT